jgi:hypothetical protein
MSQLSAQPVSAQEKLTICDHPSTDAGADRKVDEIILPKPSSVTPFTECGYIGIVPKGNWALKVGGEFIADRNVHPSG